MSKVIGIPSIKGNNEVVVGCQLRGVNADAGDFSDYNEGQFVFDGGTAQEPDVFPTFGAQTGTGLIVGWVFDINRCSGYASLGRSAEQVTLPTLEAGDTFTIGDQVLVDSATGLISATGDIPTNGVIVEAGLTFTGVYGKDGSTPALKAGTVTNNAVLVRFLSKVQPLAPTP